MFIRKLVTILAGLVLLTVPATAQAAPAEQHREVDISTNYAWFQGDIYWDGDSFEVGGTIHDTPQLPSNSWARIAYKHYYGGSWHQKYATPDPFWSVGNGGSQYNAFTRFGGSYKDVWLDLCSKRNGETYCTGWK